MAETVKIQRFLPDFKVELAPTGSEACKTFTFAYITSPNGDPDAWATALRLKPGDEVGMQEFYVYGDEIFGNLFEPLPHKDSADSIMERLLSEGLAVIRSDADALQGFDKVAPRLRAYQVLAQGGLKGFWKDWQSSPTSTLAIGNHSMPPSGGSMWRFDPGLCSITKQVRGIESAACFIIFENIGFGPRNPHFHLSSVRIPSSIELWAKNFVRRKLGDSHLLFAFEAVSYTADNVLSIMGNMSLGGMDVASILVEHGLAIPTCSSSDLALLTPHEQSLLELQTTAIREKRGVHLYSHSLSTDLTNASETHLTAEHAFSRLRDPTGIPAKRVLSPRRGQTRISAEGSLSLVREQTQFRTRPTRARVRGQTRISAGSTSSPVPDQTRFPAKLLNATSGGVLNFEITTKRIVLTLVLGRVWVPRVEEPFGKEALELVTSIVSGENVELSIESIDADGRFIGDVYLPRNSDALSVALVKEGLADVREAQAKSEPQNGLSKLESAKKVAADAQRGLWQAATDREEEPSNSRSADNALLLGKYVEVSVYLGDTFLFSRWGRDAYQFIIGTGTLYDHIDTLYGLWEGCEVEEDDESGDDDRERFNGLVYPFATPPKVGDHVMTLNDLEGLEFHRGIVIAVQDKAENGRPVHTPYTVRQVDRGESWEFGESSLSSIPEPISFSKIPPFYMEMSLSFLDFPTLNLSNRQVLLDVFFTPAKGQKLVARIDVPDFCSRVTLFRDKSNRLDDSVNWLMAREGIADVESLETARAWAKFPQWEVVYNSLCEARDTARLDGVGIWKPSNEVSQG